MPNLQDAENLLESAEFSQVEIELVYCVFVHLLPSLGSELTALNLPLPPFQGLAEQVLKGELKGGCFLRIVAMVEQN